MPRLAVTTLLTAMAMLAAGCSARGSAPAPARGSAHITATASTAASTSPSSSPAPPPVLYGFPAPPCPLLSRTILDRFLTGSKPAAKPRKVLAPVTASCTWSSHRTGSMLTLDLTLHGSYAEARSDFNVAIKVARQANTGQAFQGEWHIRHLGDQATAIFSVLDPGPITTIYLEVLSKNASLSVMLDTIAPPSQHVKDELATAARTVAATMLKSLPEH